MLQSEAKLNILVPECVHSLTPVFAYPGLPARQATSGCRQLKCIEQIDSEDCPK